MRGPGCAWTAALLVLAGSSSCALAAEPARGDTRWVTVTRVSDGDTVWVKDGDTRPFKLRLMGFDAPERCQPWGSEATQALKARVQGQRVRIETWARDDYRRVLGRLFFADGGDIGAWMVSQGHAWSYHGARGNGPYAREEKAARSQRRGLFADPSAIEPRLFRRTHGPCD